MSSATTSNMIKLSRINVNPKNPRLIKDHKFKSLVKSLKEFPEMMKLRPIVVNDDGIILGGNMRYRALIELSYIEIPDEWVIKASDLTEEQQKEFLIKDNVGFGEWDWDILANEWEADQLEGWGVDVPGIEFYSDKNKEIDVSEFDDKMIIKLQFSEEDYHKVKKALLLIAPTPEEAIFKLLKFSENE